MKLGSLIGLLMLLLGCNQSNPKQMFIPKVIPTFSVLRGLENEVFNGLIQIRKITDPGSDLLINEKGEVVWYHLADTALFRPITPNGEGYLSMYNDREVFEMTYKGDTLLDLTYGSTGFDRTVHHEVIYDGANIAALTKEKLKIDLSSLGGSEVDSIISDGIIVLNREGEKVWNWSIFDVMDPLKDSAILKSKRDWGHANSLALDNDGHYLISWRNFNEVWKVDRATGNIIWKYGHDELSDESQKFYGQHTFHTNTDGTYIMFDNGNKKDRMSSRALGFTYSDGSGFNQVFSISLPDSLFTSKQGSVYQFEKDRFLFSSSMSSGLVVTNSDGDVLWYAKSSEPFYRAYYIENSPL